MAVKIKRKTWRILAVAVVVVAVGLALGLTLGRSRRTADAGTSRTTVVVERGDITNTLVAYGTVEPKQEYTFAFDGDRVESTQVRVGERVTKGQTLVVLDAAEQQLALLRAERALAEAKAGGVPANVREAELVYGIARANYDDATLKAPFAGVVTEIDQAAGSSENWSLVLIDTSELYIEAEIDQLDAPAVAVGQSATAVIEALPDRTWNVQIVEVGGMAETSGNSTIVIAKANLPNADSSILVGYTVEMEITTASATDVLLVPISCLVETPKGWTVMKVVDGKPSPQAVTIGTKSDTHAEIQTGLAEGDLVLNPTGSAEGVTRSGARPQGDQFPAGGVMIFGGPGMP